MKQSKRLLFALSALFGVLLSGCSGEATSTSTGTVSGTTSGEITSNPSSEPSDDNFQGLDFYPLDDGTYGVGYGKAIFLSKIVIPETYKGRKVTRIIDYGFSGDNYSQYNKNIKTIVLPDSLVSIGKYAFYGCTSLETASFNMKGDVSIEEYAFAGCTSIESVSFASGEDISIEEYAFSGCHSLISINFGNSNISLADYAFDSCSSLKSVILGNSVIFIGRDTFNKCVSLEYIEDDQGKYLGNSSNSHLALMRAKVASSTYDVSDECQFINSFAFSSSTSLVSAFIPKSVTAVGESIFADCLAPTIFCEAESQPANWNSNWQKTSYPLTVIWGYKETATIGNYTYALCEIEGAKIAAVVEFDENVTSFNPPSEVNGHAVKSIAINSLLLTENKHATKVESIVLTNGITSISPFSFTNYSSLTSVALPQSLSSIGSYAFYSCSSLNSIIIPKSVSYIGYGTFLSCSSITIYCEVESQPSTWDQDWNMLDYYNNCPVVWGYSA